MKLMEKLHNARLPLLILAILLLTMTAKMSASVSAQSNGKQAIDNAWDNAIQRDSYQFSGNITQVNIPEATIANISKGGTDHRQETTALRLWSDSSNAAGNVFVPESGMEIQVAEGKTQVRRGNAPWEEVAAGSANNYMPQGNFLAYLTAATEVTTHASETLYGISFTRHSFVVDGPLYADYVRDQMADAMSARGELPPGMELQASDYYANMTGTGELWVGDDGLPLRQILTLEFPQQQGEQVHAEISIVFSDYGEKIDSVGFWNNTTQLKQTINNVMAKVIVTLTASGFIASILMFRRKRIVHAGLAFSISASMVFTPFLSIPIGVFVDQFRPQRCFLEIG